MRYRKSLATIGKVFIALLALLSIPLVATAFQGDAGIPTVPSGCMPPRLEKKLNPIVTSADLSAASADAVFAQILAGGYLEADILIDQKGRSQPQGSGNTEWFSVTSPAGPRSAYLQKLLSSNLDSWRWTPATCSGSSIRAIIPSIVGLELNSQYFVYSLAHVRYEFHIAAGGDYGAATELTLGNTRACKHLRLTPGDPTIILGVKAAFLTCMQPGERDMTFVIDPNYVWRIIHLGASPLNNAQTLCPMYARGKIQLPNFDHSDVARSLRISAGSIISNVAADQGDIAVTGSVFYKSPGSGLTAVGYSCLFSPNLGVKSIELKP